MSYAQDIQRTAGHSAADGVFAADDLVYDTDKAAAARLHAYMINNCLGAHDIDGASEARAALAAEEAADLANSHTPGRFIGPINEF